MGKSRGASLRASHHRTCKSFLKELAFPYPGMVLSNSSSSACGMRERSLNHPPSHLGDDSLSRPQQTLQLRSGTYGHRGDEAVI
ncbi:rCG25098 [Rattus norvegicus]|uniref:RCG25098 n=1 Tax=Rattus norvegicus TaxID=10116 RepID=A6I2Q7_RAT|nr:rCG25098 [Rattus norvegicus]